MSDVSLTQISVVVVFLAALLALQFWIKRHKGTLGAQLHRGRRMKLIEALPLGDGARLLLIEVDGKTQLLSAHKSSAPIPLPQPEGAA